MPLPLLVSLACRPAPSSEQVAQEPAGERAAARQQVPSEAAPTRDPAPSSADWLTRLAGAAPRTSSLPDGVAAEGDCTILYPPPADEMLAEAQAIVPLKPGLTLATMWQATNTPDDVECLLHVTEVGADAIGVSNSCPVDGREVEGSRRTCRADLRRARVYYTEFGGSSPETVVGATTFSLSREAYLELKRQGATRHRYLELKNDGSKAEVNLEGPLTLDGPGTLSAIVNDRPVDLPVLRVSGRLRGPAFGKPSDTRVSAAVLDDERFPIVLDYRLLDLGSQVFSLRYSKISYPTGEEIEKRLDTAKRVDVYGIYFDSASDRIRAESEPVLKEIGDVLRRNADWRVSIEGHTDSIGTDEANLELSRRRSAAVSAALIDRHGVEPERLTTAGYGESAPKAGNDTPEGRARNRRVELVRR